MIKEISLWFYIVLSCILVSCVHEYPDDEPVDPTNVAVTLKLSTTEPFEFVSRATDGTSRYMHYIVEIYKDDYQGTPVLRKEVTVKKQDGGSSLTLEFPLHSAHYKVAAWASVSDEKGSNSLFSTAKLSAVTLVGNYTGNMLDKECYDARFDIDLSNTGWNESRSISQKLTSPMAGIEIISTDVSQFQNTQNGLWSVESLSDTWWQNYYLKWAYDMYFPTSYNVYTGMPNKVATQVAFRSEIKRLSDKEVSLGYDYVFVNGQKANQYISLSLYRRDDLLLNTYEGIDASLERGKLTTIKGEFLTRKHSSGMGIDPGFDGSIDINR